jgi:hypothetical protein
MPVILELPEITINLSPAEARDCEGQCGTGVVKDVGMNEDELFGFADLKGGKAG